VRGHQWRRFKYEAASSNQDQSSIMCVLAPGETIIRMRGQTNLSVFYTSPAITRGLPVCWGIFIQGHDTAGPLLNPNHNADIASQLWMWWEGITLFDSPQVTGSPAQYPAYGPQGDPTRDVRAQRKADPSIGSDVWIRGVSDPNVTVGNYFWSWSWSILVQLAT